MMILFLLSIVDVCFLSKINTSILKEKFKGDWVS